MAGSSITVAVDDRALRRALARLQDAGGDPDRAWRDIGEHLLETTRERFRTETSPGGDSWAPLSERYRRRKQRNADKILTARGTLSGTLTYQVGDGELRVGSNRVYAATHQFGRGPIPARPFLGLSDDDRDYVLEALTDHLNRVLREG
ncbi:MAG: phage virion morphogenesis protein [Thiohalospira sp.]